ncbi:MAG: hypothetical protein ACK40K_02015 [Raineya sp.]
MLKERIIVSCIVIGLISSLVYTINKYENSILKQQFRVIDGAKTSFTQKEILDMIKSLPDYQGDSLIIYEDGTIKSLNAEINGGLAWNLNDKPTRTYLEGIAKSEKLPLAYVVYRHVIPYYIEQQKQKQK